MQGNIKVIQKTFVFLLLILLVLLLAKDIVVSAVHSSGLLSNNARNSITFMAHGTAERPFVYRTLVPSIADVLSAITPVSMQSAVNQQMSHIVDMPMKPDMEPAGQQALYVINVSILLMYVALVAYGLAMGRVALKLFPQCRYVSSAVSLLSMIVLLPFIDGDTKLYDFPMLALSALCLLFFCQQKWGYYLLFFSLACINKETAIFQIGLFILIYGTRLKERFFRNVFFLQSGIYIAIVGFIHYIFSSNRGIVAWYHTNDIIGGILVDLKNPIHMILVILLCWLIMSKWREMPVLLRRSLWLLPVNMILYYTCCMWGEYRDLFEIFPYLTLIAGYTIFRPFDQPGKIHQPLADKIGQ